MKLNSKLLGMLATICALATEQVYATAQIPDFIVVDGEKHRLHTEPLASYLRSNPSVKIPAAPFCTASWRGYRATWEVVDRKLYLIEIDSSPCSDTPQVVPVNVIFPNESERKFADWYSGVITIPQCNLVKPIPGGYASKYERYLTLTIKDGIIVSTDRHDMAEEERREEAKWREFLEKQRKVGAGGAATQGKN